MLARLGARYISSCGIGVVSYKKILGTDKKFWPQWERVDYYWYSLHISTDYTYITILLPIFPYVLVSIMTTSPSLPSDASCQSKWWISILMELQLYLNWTTLWCELGWRNGLYIKCMQLSSILRVPELSSYPGYFLIDFQLHFWKYPG